MSKHMHTEKPRRVFIFLDESVFRVLSLQFVFRNKHIFRRQITLKISFSLRDLLDVTSGSRTPTGSVNSSFRPFSKRSKYTYVFFISASTRLAFSDQYVGLFLVEKD